MALYFADVFPIGLSSCLCPVGVHSGRDSRRPCRARLVQIPRPEWLGNLDRDQGPDRVRAPEEPGLAVGPSRRALVAHPLQRSDLPDRLPRRYARDDRHRPAEGKHSLGAGRAAGQDEGRRQAEQPCLPEPGGRRERRLRVLSRLRAHCLRRRRQGAVVDAARPLQQHLRHGRLAGHRRRPRRPGVRSEPWLVRDGREQADRPRAVEGRSARSQERPLDADRLARARRQGSDPGAGVVSAHRLRRRDGQKTVVGGWIVVRDEVDAGHRRRHDLRQRLRRARERSRQEGHGAARRRGLEDGRR